LTLLQATGSQRDGVWKDEFHTSELKQKTQKKNKEKKKETESRKKGVMCTWEPA
jgi:hypothetical protein